MAFFRGGFFLGWGRGSKAGYFKVPYFTPLVIISGERESCGEKNGLCYYFCCCCCVVACLLACLVGLFFFFFLILSLALGFCDY